MELKERPVVSQLQVVRERIRVIRKILSQSDQLKQKRPPENYPSNNEVCEEEDETVFQARKNLRDLIETLNSGKEDKYTNDMNSNDYTNDYYNDDEYNNSYSNEVYQQTENKKKKRQLATISVQNTAFHQKTQKTHNRSAKKSSKQRNKKEIYEQADSPSYKDSISHDNKKRIFGLKNKKDRRFDFRCNFNEEFEQESSDYSSSSSSSYFYCPVCSHKIHKRSKSPKGCRLHQTKKRRNASISRKCEYDVNHFNILSESTTSCSSLSDDCLNLDDYTSYDEEYVEKDINPEKKVSKSYSKSGSISSYYTSTSTLLNRYGSSPSASLESSYNLYISDDDDDLSRYDLSDDDDVDVDKILRNLEKRRIHLSSINDPYFGSLSRVTRAENNRVSKRNQNEKQVSCSNNSISLKPRHKFDDSISSSCSVLSDLLDEMSEEEKRLSRNQDITQSLKKSILNKENPVSKYSSPQLNNNKKQRKKKQTSRSNSESYEVNSSSKNQEITKSNSEEDKQLKSSLNEKELIHILQNPLTKDNQPKKAQHTVKFILEEEEEDTQNNAKSSSSNNSSNMKKAISMVVNINEEEELSEDIFFNSSLKANTNIKLEAEEESLFESSENSNENVIFMKKLNQNQKDYSVEDIEEEINEGNQKDYTRKIDISLSKSKEEEESLFEIRNQSVHDSNPKKQTTSSSLYNDVDDIDLDLEEEEINNDVHQVKIKIDQTSEEENLSNEIPQPIVEEEEEDEIFMVNHLKEEEEEITTNNNIQGEEEEITTNNNIQGEEEDFEEDNFSEKFKFENDELSDNDEEIENQIQNNNENENNQDQKSHHTLSDFAESGSVNIADDDFF